MALRTSGASLTVNTLNDVNAANEMPVTMAAVPLPASAATAANQRPPATTPVIYNVNIVLANTEYLQALPAGAKMFSLQCLTDFDIRFAFETGRVAAPVPPYALVRAGMNYFEDGLNLATATLYVASSSAGIVAEVIVWS